MNKNIEQRLYKLRAEENDQNLVVTHFMSITDITLNG